MDNDFNIIVLPRHTMSWDEFLSVAPECSIGLDGIVSGGPQYNPVSRHINFDHHDHVIREATMCTAMQVFVAIKGGLIKRFLESGKNKIHIYINDTDQDTCFAVWLLDNYKKFEGVQNNVAINRLLDITNKLDITGGGFPMNLRHKLMRQHCWIFKPYSDLRKSGQLAVGNCHVLRDNLDAVMARLTQAYIGEADEEEMDTRSIILHDSPKYKIVDEIGGNDARYALFAQGMDAFVSIVAHRNDGNLVISIGKRSQYVDFPIEDLYDDLNAAEGLTRTNGWNGSGIIGGSSRQSGTSLSWEQIRDIVDARLAR